MIGLALKRVFVLDSGAHGARHRRRASVVDGVPLLAVTGGGGAGGARPRPLQGRRRRRRRVAHGREGVAGAAPRHGSSQIIQLLPILLTSHLVTLHAFRSMAPPVVNRCLISFVFDCFFFFFQIKALEQHAPGKKLPAEEREESEFDIYLRDDKSHVLYHPEFRYRFLFL